MWEYNYGFGPVATSRLHTNSTSATGAQSIRSPALGVIRLSTRLAAEKATATQTIQRATRSHPLRAIPARDSTMPANPTNIPAWTNAAMRSSGGNWPGKGSAHGVRTPRRTQRQCDLECHDDGRGYRINNACNTSNVH